ncbi:MAG TPA: hypothetical protein VH186_38500 [Chloroflexia bacterium]|nr:hypothetical protein [Chloroflexia bacterium]
MRGDINATELYQDREFLTRVGLGIMDVEFGSSGAVGFEDVRRFSYVADEEEDPKLYRRRVFNLVGRYYPNHLARVMWQKFIDHKWVLSEHAGREVSLEESARDWMERYSHDFLKEWTLQEMDIPFRMRSTAEPSRGWLEVGACIIAPQWRELLEAGFSLPLITAAALVELRPGRKVKERLYLRIVARLSGLPVSDKAELLKRHGEIKQLEQHMSQKYGYNYGMRAATIEYYRRLNLLAEFEGKTLTTQLTGQPSLA